jgi:hypothetical protein
LKNPFSAHVRFGVKFHDMPYSLSPDILYSWCYLRAVAAGRESGKRYAFSKAAEPPSFPPWLEFSISQRWTNDDDLPVVRFNSRMRVVQ